MSDEAIPRRVSLVPTLLPIGPTDLFHETTSLGGAGRACLRPSLLDPITLVFPMVLAPPLGSSHVIPNLPPIGPSIPTAHY